MSASLFDQYKSLTYDEMFDEHHGVRTHWEKLYKALETLDDEQFRQRQSDIDWRLEENGVSYNVYDDPEGFNRPWRLDPIPFIIDSKEWDQIESGLKQRALLMDHLLKDIYGKQRVLKEGIIPAELVFSHQGFIRAAHNLMHSKERALKIYAADLSRGPDGKMWVINDRTQAPSGLGYAIENRLAMNGAMHEIYGNIGMRRLSNFLDDFKAMLYGAASTQGKEALHVLLSPGPYNEAYFEHSYLSYFLGLTLVQGDDLLSKDGKLWLRTLRGLRRVDTLLRRVDDLYCDPLELHSESQLGVAGLMQTLRSGHLTMANPIGSGLLENSGLNPFMNAACRFYLDEALQIPQIATWWCGQKKERDYVLEHLSTLIIKRIDRSLEPHTFVGERLSQKELEHLRHAIVAEPYRYSGQERVEFSSVPTYNGKRIEARKAMIRAFGVGTNDGYSIMPGGLVRVGYGDDSLKISNQNGGGSKDLWVVDEDREQSEVPSSIYTHANVAAQNDFLTSLRAENLFWLGRYLTRSIIAARMLRTALKLSSNLYRSEQRYSDKSLMLFYQALTHLTMTYPGFLDNQPQAFSEIRQVIIDPTRVGSLAQSLKMLADTNASIKNMFSQESWRIFDKLMRDFSTFSRNKNSASRMLAGGVENLLMQLMAYRQLIEESLFAKESQLLYGIGNSLERAQLVVSKCRGLLVQAVEPQAQNEVLENLLLSCEKFNAYRSKYRLGLHLEPVMEFMLLDRSVPTSLVSELDQLQHHLKELPHFHSDAYLSRFEAPVFEAYSLLRLAKMEKLTQSNEGVRKELDLLLGRIGSLMADASNELGKTYFAHYDE